MSGVTVLVTCGVSVLATLVGLTARAHLRYARLGFFRCRLGPPTDRRRGMSRWCVRRTWAAWTGDVLLVRSGLLRLWLTPLAVRIPREVAVVALRKSEVRGLGLRPRGMRFTVDDGDELEIAVAAENVDELIGPFLTAALPGMPGARRPSGG